MRFTDEVAWGAADFVFAGTLIFGTGLAYVLAARKGSGIAYRVALGMALLAMFLLVWMNLAVGIIGSEGNPANLMYAGVLLVGIAGALIARFKPRGMARAMSAAALAQALIAAVALIAKWGQPLSGPLETLLLNGIFFAMFAGSAWLFRRAARVPV